MVRADEGGRSSLVRPAHAVAAVATAVQQAAESTVAVATQDDAVLAHVGGDEIAAVGNLALVPQIQPTAGEDRLQLALVDAGLDEDAPTNGATRGVDQRGEILLVDGHVLPLVDGRWPRRPC